MYLILLFLLLAPVNGSGKEANGSAAVTVSVLSLSSV